MKLLLRLTCLLAFISGSTGIVLAQPAGWQYFQRIELTNTFTQRTNFQVLIEVDTRDLLAQGKINPDGNDFRFTENCDGSSPITFFQETTDLDTNKAAFWLLFSSIPAAGIDTVYMFYGNDTATSASDFDNTFPNSLIIDEAVPDFQAGRIQSNGSLVDINDVDWFEVTENGSITFSENANMNGFFMQVRNTRKIKWLGGFDGTGHGFRGGTATASPALGDGAGEDGGTSTLGAGAGGGAYGGAGGDGSFDPVDQGAEGAGGQPHGLFNDRTVIQGSGGGATQNSMGGNGGAGLSLNALSVEFGPNANIVSNGANFRSFTAPVGAFGPSGGGGGSGGGILIEGGNVRMEGAFSAQGGLGLVLQDAQGENNGYPGGSGGGGRIKVFYARDYVNTATFNVAGAPAVVSDNVISATGNPGDTGTYYEQRLFTALDEPSIAFFEEQNVGTVELVSSEPGDSVCLGADITFTATSGYDNYEFLVNSTTVQNGASNELTLNNLNNRDTVAAVLTQSGGCLDTTNRIVVIVMPLPNTTINPAGPFCLEEGFVTLTSSAPGGVWSGRGITNPNLGTFNTDTAGVGITTIKYVASTDFGCVDSSTLDIRIQTVIPMIVAPDTFCIAGSADTLVGTPEGGIWSGNGIVDTAEGVFDPAEAGVGLHFVMYQAFDTIFRTNDTAVCTATAVDSIVVTKFIETPETVCELQGIVDFFEVDESGFWEGPGIVDPVKGLMDPFDASPGTYEYRYIITDSSNACVQAIGLDTLRDTTTVIKAPFVNAGNDRTICSGEVTRLGGSPTILGGTPPFTITWFPDTFFIDGTNTANPRVKPRETTTYYVVLEDSTGCTMVDSVVINISNDQIIVDAGRDTTICFQASVIIGGNPTASSGLEPYTYRWEPTIEIAGPSTVPNPSVKPADTTNFTLTVTDVNGCTILDSIVVAVNPQLRANAGGNIDICAEDCGVLGDVPAAQGGTGEYGYSWLPVNFLDSTKVDNPAICPEFQGKFNYTLTVEDSLGCQAFDSVTVSVFPKPTVEAGDDIGLCLGDSVQLFAIADNGTPPYNFAWRPIYNITSVNIGNPFVFPTVDTTYTVFISDANDCKANDSVNVFQFDMPTADAGSNILVCEGTVVELGGAPPVFGGAGDPYIYTWSPRAGLDDSTAPNPEALPDFTTVYTLIGEDGNGCIAIDSILVNVVEPFETVLSVEQTSFCKGDGQINIFPSPAGGTFSGNPGVVNQGVAFTEQYFGEDLIIRDNDPGGTFASLIIENAPGDILGEDVYISSVDFEIIHPNVSELTVILSKADGDAVILMDRPGLGLQTGPCTGANIHACVVLGENAPPRLRNVCNNDEFAIEGTFTSAIDDLNFFNESGGNPNDKWQLIIVDHETGNVGTLTDWSMTFGTPALFDPSKAGMGNQMITYQVEDCFGCEQVVEQSVKVSEKPIANAGKDKFICETSGEVIGAMDGTQSLTASGGTPPYKYEWSPATGLTSTTEANPGVNIEEDIVYSVVVTDNNNCSSLVNDIALTVLPSPKGDFEAIQVNDLTIEFKGKSDISFNTWAWEFGDGAIEDFQNPFHRYSQEGTYTVKLTVTNPSNGCSDIIVKQVEVAENFLGIEEDEWKGVTLYPNPVSAFLTVSSVATELVSIELLDVNGKLQAQFNLKTFSDKHQIDMTSYPAGIYFVKVIGAKNSQQYQIVKQ